MTISTDLMISDLNNRYGSTVTRKQLTEYAKSIGISLSTACTRMKNYKTGRGVYELTVKEKLEAKNNLESLVYQTKTTLDNTEMKSKLDSSELESVTKLVTEKYQSDNVREDQSLYYTMKGIKERLDWDLEVKHPVLDEYLTKGTDDSKTKFLREKLDEALKNLDVLFEPDCTRSQALKAWGKVFNTSYFSDRDSSSSKSAAATMAGAIASTPSVPEILIAEGPKPWREL